MDKLKDKVKKITLIEKALSVVASCVNDVRQFETAIVYCKLIEKELFQLNCSERDISFFWYSIKKEASVWQKQETIDAVFLELSPYYF